MEQGITKRKGKIRHTFFCSFMCPGTKPVPGRDFFLFHAFKSSKEGWKNTKSISFSMGKLQSHPWPCCREQLSLCCISESESTGDMEPEISSATVPQLEPELTMLNRASLSWELEWAVLDCTAKQFKQMTNLNPSVLLLL